MSTGIAILGMACRYPEADSPVALWENILGGRRSFRRIPDVRLNRADYFNSSPSDTDRTSCDQAALLTGFAFDRLRHSVPGDAFRAADLVHWLALEVALDSLGHAGFPAGAGLPRDTTGIIVGNTLTGEFSRANALRLRWPYVRRTVAAELAAEGLAADQVAALLTRLELRFKAPFPEMGEESLAGSLSNTIAGRIANHVHLRGGGYTVDAACASSLQAVALACTALAAGELDAALVGGVDLSLDPFELVGFARAGALATSEMRVYDARSQGFWPGEGCGFVLLAREGSPWMEGRQPFAVIRGWASSSDGQGGITRPDADGQALAMARAYARAGFGIETIAFFEGHGTGTAVGDAVELEALRLAHGGRSRDRPAVIGSVKANIGHTKAAAGMAGLIKAVMATRHGVIPRTTGCRQPHPSLNNSPVLRVSRRAEAWPGSGPRRAGVSAMGFGGINTHVCLESAGPCRGVTPRIRALDASMQDAELFLFDEPSLEALDDRLARIEAMAPALSFGELADLSSHLSRSTGSGALRAAILAGSPAELVERLAEARRLHRDGSARVLDPEAGVFLGGPGAFRIGLLFPGQGVPVGAGGGAAGQRFVPVGATCRRYPTEALDAGAPTERAQPAVSIASLAGLRLLRRLGIRGDIAVGHSLGELAALHWAGCFDGSALVDIARMRGQALGEWAPPGSMAALSTGAASAARLCQGLDASVAAEHGPSQALVSGQPEAVEAVLLRARREGIAGVRLPTGRAFHSRWMADAASRFGESLAGQRLGPPARPVVSTVSGTRLAIGFDCSAHLANQVVAPVRFGDALRSAGPVDLWLEVGPGRALAGVARHCTSTPVISLDIGGPSLRGILAAAGAAHVLGRLERPTALAAGRITRPFREPRSEWFLANPCELDPAPAPVEDASPAPGPRGVTGGAPVEVLRRLIAERAELSAAAIHPGQRFLTDLHLNSIVVGEIVVAAARQLGVAPPLDPTQYANASLAEAAEGLVSGPAVGVETPAGLPDGVADWLELFQPDWVPSPLPPPGRSLPAGTWTVLGAPPDRRMALLEQSLAGARLGSGVLVMLPPDPSPEQASILLDAARLAAQSGPQGRLAIVATDSAALGFARTFHQECGAAATWLLEFADQAAGWTEAVVTELATTAGFVHARYADGIRLGPVLRRIPAADRPASLGVEDVLLVSGGGKGIAAECGLRIAADTGAAIALLGRTDPERDPALRTNLARIEQAGVRCRYLRADLTDPDEVHRAVAEVNRSLGAVTGLLHGAGLNRPRLLADLSAEDLLATLAPKVTGLANLLEAVGGDQLRLLVAFGSVIARTGLRGEADYALANGLLSAMVDRFADAHTGCRAMTVEWSVWSGVGMGERLGRIEALHAAGISALTPDDGVAALARLLRTGASGSVVATGRLGGTSPIPIEGPPLPLFRFLERVPVHYPGVELVAEAELSHGADPYLGDHIIRGEPVLPAVMMLEAMAQAAAGVAGQSVIGFERVHFDLPIVVPAPASRTLRIAALVRAPGRVEVVLRSDATRFTRDHASATVLVGPTDPARVAAPAKMSSAGLAVGPEELYGTVLFQQGRFRRLTGLTEVRAAGCTARVRVDPPDHWFAGYYPSQLVLGDPGARDAALHAIQVCVPEATVLPVSVARIDRHAPLGVGTCQAHATEVASDAGRFTYDLSIAGSDGQAVESWQGLELRTLEPRTQRSWPAALVGPVIERRLRQLIPAAALTVVAAPEADRPGSDPGRRVPRRPDGKPDRVNGRSASATHPDGLRLTLSSPGLAACDAALVVERSAATWAGLLGPAGWDLVTVTAQAAGEAVSTSATRVWCVREALKKAGGRVSAPVVLDSVRSPGTVLYRSGTHQIVTMVLGVLGTEDPLIVAILVAGVPTAESPMAGAEARHALV